MKGLVDTSDGLQRFITLSSDEDKRFDPEPGISETSVNTLSVVQLNFRVRDHDGRAAFELAA